MGNTSEGVQVSIAGGEARIANLTVITSGERSNGLAANTSGSMEVSNSTVTTAGNNANPLYAAGGTLSASNMVLASTGGFTPNGRGAFGATATLGGVITLSESTIDTSGQIGLGIWAHGSTITANDVAIHTMSLALAPGSNVGAYGVGAEAASLVTLNGGSILTEGDLSIGGRVSESGSLLQITGTSITTNGPRGTGFATRESAIGRLANVSIVTNGDLAYGITATTLSQATATDTAVTVNGDSGYGAFSYSGSNLTLTRGTITVNGLDGQGAGADGAGSRAIIQSTGVATLGQRGAGVVASDTGHVWLNVDPLTGLPTGTSMVVTTAGADAYGLYAKGTASVISPFTDGDIDSSEPPPLGLAAEGPSTLVADSVTVATSGTGAHGARADAGGVLQLSNVTLSTSGNQAAALNIDGPGSVAVFAGTNMLLTSGEEADGILVSGGATVSFLDALSLQPHELSGLRSALVHVTGVGSIATIANLPLSNGIVGTLTTGLRASDGGLIDYSDSSLTISGAGLWAQGLDALIASTNNVIRAGADGARAEGGATITATADRIESAGHALHAISGATIEALDTTLLSTGPSAAGMFAEGGASISSVGGEAVTLGEYAPGAWAQSSGTVSFQGRIVTTGPRSDGLLSEGAGSLVSLQSSSAVYTGVLVGTDPGDPATYGRPLDINGNATDVVGAFLPSGATDANAAHARTGGGILIADSTLVTLGTASDALRADGEGASIGIEGGSLVTMGSASMGASAHELGQISLSGVSIATQADFVVLNSEEVGAYGLASFSGGQIAMTGGTITTPGTLAIGAVATGDGSLTSLDGVAVSTTGARAAGLFAASLGLVRANGGTVNTGGDNGYGIWVGANGSAETEGTNVATTGSLAHAVFANEGGAWLTGGSFQTSGDTAAGFVALSAGSLVGATDISVGTSGFEAPGVFAIDGGRIFVNVDSDTFMPIGTGSAIRTSGADSDGLRADGPMAFIQAAGVDVETSGTVSMGAHTLNGGQIMLAGSQLVPSQIRTIDLTTIGLLAEGGQIDAGFTTVESAGHGGIAEGPGQIFLHQGFTLQLAGDNKVGLGADGGGIIRSDGPIEVTMGAGTTARTAVYAHDGGQVALAGGSLLKIEGGAGTGMVFDNSQGTGPNVGVSILLDGSGADGSTGVVALDTGTARFENLSVSGSTAAGGALAQGPSASISLSGQSRITILGSSPTWFQLESADFRDPPTTSFATRRASQAFGLAAIDGGSIASQGSVIAVTSAGGYGVGAVRGTAQLSGGSVTTSGANSWGLFASHGGIAGSNVDVSTSGGGAALMLMDVDPNLAEEISQIQLTGSDVSATGEATVGIHGIGRTTSGVRASLVGGTLSSEGTAIWTEGGARIRLESETAAAPVLMRSDFLDGGIVPSPGAELLAIDSELSGDILVGSGMRLLADLDRGTIWTGGFSDADAASRLRLTGSSIWNVTRSSNVGSIVNAGIIDFAPPQADQFKQITTITYTGEAGLMRLNTRLDGDGSPSDQLVIDGGTAGGSGTTLTIRNYLGQGALTPGNGILVVSAINGGTTQAGTFRLGGPVLAGPYEYSLRRGSRDASAPQSWFLRNTIAPDPEPRPDPDPDPEPIPHYRQEVSIYAAVPAMLLVQGRLAIDTLHERVGDERQLQGDEGLKDGPSVNGIWGRFLAKHGKQNSREGIYGQDGPNYTLDSWGLQAGVDLYRLEKDDGSTNHIGLWGAYNELDGDVQHTLPGNEYLAGTMTAESWSIGFYFTHFADNGTYLDTILQATWSKVEASSTRLPQVNLDAFTVAAGIEGGHPFPLSETLLLEPQAQLLYQGMDIDHFTDEAASVSYRNLRSLAGRVGVRLNNTGPRQGWIRVNYWHEFMGQPRTQFSVANGLVGFETQLPQDWGEIDAGFSFRLGRHATLFGAASYQITFDGVSYSIDGKIGLRLNW